MTEEAAALLITRYANGLRHELELLGASEITDLVSEVVSMLREASAGDLAKAAAEIDKLGPPSDLARAILEERGLPTGTPAASWWRLGVAAPIDILVGLAAPVAAACFALASTVVGAPMTENDAVVRLGAAVVSMAAIAFTGAVAWSYWKPWREGGTRLTVGMTLAGISIVRVGGTRSVVLTSDLERAKLAHGVRSRAAAIVWVVIAISILVWGGSFLLQTADTGNPSVERLAGDAAVQQDMVRSSIDGFYQGLIDPATADPEWPTAWMDPAGLGVEPLSSVLDRARTPQLKSYRIVSMTSPEPGLWDVVIEEQRDTLHEVKMTLGLRIDWGVGYMGPSWVIRDYVQ